MTKEFINLEFPQELIDTKIVDDGVFEIATKRFVIDLNHIHKGKRIIFSYNKNWKIIKRDLREEAKLKGLSDRQIQLLEETVDNNYHSVSITQEQEQGNSSNNNNNNFNNNKNEGKKTVYPINKYSQGISLVEAILIDNVPYFLSLTEDEDKNPVLYKKIPLTEDMDIVPPERTEYLSKEYSFKSEKEVYHYLDLARHETLDSLFKKIKNILGKYIDMDDDFINILTADVVFTYFQDKLGMTHYILIVGDNNTGKSNILLVFSILGYRAILDTSITPANIYNFGSQLEESQHTIIEDELGNIDEQFDKKRMYQVSYRSGTNVTRMYDNNNPGNTARKSSRQQRFFLYCFKMFATEEMPDKVKSKGFLERLIPLKALPGNPDYDIAEILDESGDEEFKKLNQELMDTRKLLLMYRLLHHIDPILNVELNIKNRYKQLTKPLIRLFQNSKCLDEIIKSLSKYVIEKNEEKVDSLDSELLYLVTDLVKVTEPGSDRKTKLMNKEIWKAIQERYPEGEIKDKEDGKTNSYCWNIEGLGTISKKRLTEICSTKFGAIKYRDRALGRALKFDINTLNKIAGNYSIIEGIQIIKYEKGEK